MTKFYIIFVFLSLFAIMQVVFCDTDNTPPYPSPANDFVNLVISQASAKIESKYRLCPYGVGISMPGGSVRTLGLAYQVRGALSKEAIRAMLVDCAQMFLQTVLDCEGIKPFLHDPGFDIKNVRIILYISDATGRQIYDPEVGVAEISHAKLTYRTHDRENEFRFKNRFEESYEEALRAVQDGVH